MESIGDEEKDVIECSHDVTSAGMFLNLPCHFWCQILFASMCVCILIICNFLVIDAFRYVRVL